jgi:hypothetical protein
VTYDSAGAGDADLAGSRSAHIRKKNVDPSPRAFDTTYINLHHLYITQRAMVRNGVQAGERDSA